MKVFCWRLMIGAISLGVSSVVLAGSWKITPLVEATSVYTDNLFLDPGQEVDDFIYTVTPGFQLEALGRRLQLNLKYMLEAVHYQNHSEFDDQYHQLDSDGQLQLIEEHLFVDFSASYSQSDIDLDQAGSGDNLSVSDNRTDVKTWNFSPFWQHRIGNKILLETRYGHRRLTDTDTTRTNSWSAFVQSLPGFGPVSWRLDLGDRRQSYEFSQAARFKSGNFRVLIPTWRHHQVIVEGGYENSDYARAPGTDTPSGGNWAVGYVWNPFQRTRYEITWGKRFFGDSLEAHFQHGQRRWLFNLDYTEDTSSSAENQFDNVDAQPGSLLQLVELGNEEIYIQKRLTTAVVFSGRRDRIRLTANRDKRDFQGGFGANEDNDNAHLSWQHDLNSKLQTDVAVNWQRRSDDSGLRDNYQWRLSMELARRVGSNLSVYGRLNHALRGGQPVANEYRNSTVTAGIKVNY